MAKDKIVAELLNQAGGKRRTQMLGEIFDRFYEKVGGPEAFADLLYTEFMAAQPGSLTRQRILDVVLKTTKALDEKAEAASTLDGMSEEDLMREFQAILKEQGVQIGTPTNQPPAAATAATGPGGAAGVPAAPAPAAQGPVGAGTNPPA